MAELTLNSDQINEILRRHLDSYTPGMATTEVGRIISVGDGIAHVSGLPNAAVNELLEFADGTTAEY